jgi:hypothetical protein
MLDFRMFSIWVAIAGYVAYVCRTPNDTVVAATNLIALAISLVWTKHIVYGDISPILEFYKNILGTRNIAAVLAVDIAVHFLPAILLGVAKKRISYFYAFMIFLVWYIVYRYQLESMYHGMIDPEGWTDAAVVVALGAVVAFSWREIVATF